LSPQISADLRPEKSLLGYFVPCARNVIVSSDLRLSLCLLVGALGMILSKVLSIDEVIASWST
jgi:hypothetical protein